MRALVTGSAGFIGSSIAERLLGEQHEVVGVDCFTDYYDTALKRRNLERLAGDRFDFVEGDLNALDLDALLDGVDVIFHQAGQPGVRDSWGAGFAPYTAHNIAATQALLEAARRAPQLARFVAASSSSVYGEAESYPTRETDLPRPKSPYGVTKLAAEHLATLYGRNFGVPTTSLRYFTVYGPRQRPDMAFTRFLRAAIENDTIKVFGTGEQVRDFTYIDDIVDANLLAATTEHEAGAVFNVAGGGQVSVNEVLEIIEDLVGHPLDVQRLDVAAGDVSRTCGATDHIESVLGWRATTSVADGLRTQHAWAQEALPLLTSTVNWK